MPANIGSSPRVRNQTVSRKRRRQRKRRLALVAATAVIFLLLLAILIDSTLYIGKVHAGVTVAGIDLGGMTPEKAKAALDKRVDDAQKSQVTLASGTNTWTVAPRDVGTKFDTAATIGSAMNASRKSTFIVDRFRGFLMYFKHEDVPLEGTVDSAKMDQAVADIAQSIDVPPINAGLVFEGQQVKIVRGQKGRVVDRKVLASQLETVLLSLQRPVLQVQMTVKEPTVLADDFDQALQQATTMTGAPVTLTSGSNSWTLDAEEIIAFMDFKAESEAGGSVLVPFLSADKMRPFLDEVAAKTKTDPVNATFRGDGKKAWVVAGLSGRTLDGEKTVEALNAAALDPNDRSVKAAVTLTDPKLTTAEARSMGITDVLGDFQTVWEGTSDRQTNVRITTAYASNVLLAPGEIYDFDHQVGPRTAERGYKMAPGIVGPGQLEDVFGGGICQVSTTLFNAAFFAGLEIIERKNHSIYIPHYPKGRDATVSAGSPNLRFRNDTKHYILIRGASDGITTKFVIYGTEDGRHVEYDTGDFYDIVAHTVETTWTRSLGKSTTSIIDAGQDGQKIKVTRIVTAADGSVLHKDTFLSIWPMLPEQIEIGYGPRTPTTQKSTTSTDKTTTTTAKTTTTTTAKPTTTTEATTTTTAGG